MPKKKAEKKGSPAWMTTFADMMTLLLCFFVILFSMSQIQKIKFGGLASSLRAALSGVPDAPRRRTRIPDPQRKGSILPMPGVPGSRSPQASVGRGEGSVGDGGVGVQAGEPSQERKLVKAAGLQSFAGLIHLEEDEQHLKIRLPGDIAFKSGRAELQAASGAGEDVEEVMTRIAMVLRWTPNNVMVIGHTDDTVGRSKTYPSNWELSAARASAVVRHLLGQYKLEANRFTVVGKGSSQPLVPAISQSARSKNRRVELWIRKGKGAGDVGLQAVQ